jgi:predicted Ser/Thr protein kinase
MNTPVSPTCPKCRVALPADAPKGLCPRCLAALNLASETGFTGADAPAAQPPLTPAELAPHFPQLEILECLGRGGMGVVYKARQTSLNRLVALKLLAPERVGDARFAERFTNEAQALARLNHPNIVTVYDFGQAGGFYFLLMEFVDGLNLRQLLRARKLTPEEALAIVPPLCDALQFAHERGIVHRDIKPENLLLDRQGRVKIADFGIARMLGAEPSTIGVAETQPAGTPGYMAPEQKSAPDKVDNRADIYSLGVVFYEMLTGELPAERIQPPSRKVQIDVRLDEIVLRALEKAPELRWQTAAELRSQVETVSMPAAGSRKASVGLHPLPARSRPAWAVVALAAVAMLLAALIVVVGWVALRANQAAKVEAERARASEEMARAEAQRAARNVFLGNTPQKPWFGVPTNIGPLLVVDLWSLLHPRGRPTGQFQVALAPDVFCNSCHAHPPPAKTVRFQGPPVDESMLSESERSASSFLLVPSTDGKPRDLWDAETVQNLRAAGFLLPDAEAAREAAEQVMALITGRILRSGDSVVLFDLPRTSRGPYRAWTKFPASPTAGLPFAPPPAPEGAVQEPSREQSVSARLKLKQAEAELEAVTRLHAKGVASEPELNRNRLAVEFARAELSGDAAAANRVRLKQAEEMLDRITQLHAKGVSTEYELSKARLEVKLAKAELAGDAVGVIRVRLEQADEDFKRASELRKKFLISESDYNQSKLAVELWQAELAKMLQGRTAR